MTVDTTIEISSTQNLGHHRMRTSQNLSFQRIQNLHITILTCSNICPYKRGVGAGGGLLLYPHILAENVVFLKLTPPPGFKDAPTPLYIELYVETYAHVTVQLAIGRCVY